MDLHDALRHDLTRTEPPLGDLVGAALAEGRRRARRQRRTRALAGAGAAVALVTGLTAAAGTSGASAPQATYAQAPAPEPAGQPRDVPVHGPEPLVVTGDVPTDAELLEQVAAALQRAGLEGAALSVVDPDEAAMVQVDLVGASGPGMLRIAVGPGSQPPPTAERLPDGSWLEVGGLADNCVQHEYAVSTRPDGVAVYAGNARCLAWDGTANPPAAPPLTTAQLVALVQDRGLGG